MEAPPETATSSDQQRSPASHALQKQKTIFQTFHCAISVNCLRSKTGNFVSRDSSLIWKCKKYNDSPECNIQPTLVMITAYDYIVTLVMEGESNMRIFFKTTCTAMMWYFVHETVHKRHAKFQHHRRMFGGATVGILYLRKASKKNGPVSLFRL